MPTEVWTAAPENDRVITLTYTPGEDPYPVRQVFTLLMPDEYDPSAPNHDPFAVGFPLVTPLLQGFIVGPGTPGSSEEHPVGDLRIIIENAGWSQEGGFGAPITKQGPDVEVSAGIRDDRNTPDPPTDPFFIRVFVAALVVYPG